MSITFFNTNNYWGKEAEDWAIAELKDDKTSIDAEDLYKSWIASSYNIPFTKLKNHLEAIANNIETCEPTISEDAINDWLRDQESWDFDDAMMNLQNFFDTQNKNNPAGTNSFLLTGSVQRWDGASSGMQIEDSFKEIFRDRGLFKDCDITRIEIKGKDLELEGHHHDGGVYITARQLTNDGEHWLNRLDYGDVPEEGLDIDDKHFEEREVLDFLRYLYDNYTEDVEELIQNI